MLKLYTLDGQFIKEISYYEVKGERLKPKIIEVKHLLAKTYCPDSRPQYRTRFIKLDRNGKEEMWSANFGKSHYNSGAFFLHFEDGSSKE